MGVLRCAAYEMYCYEWEVGRIDCNDCRPDGRPNVELRGLQAKGGELYATDGVTSACSFLRGHKAFKTVTTVCLWYHVAARVGVTLIHTPSYPLADSKVAAEILLSGSTRADIVFSSRTLPAEGDTAVQCECCGRSVCPNANDGLW